MQLQGQYGIEFHAEISAAIGVKEVEMVSFGWYFDECKMQRQKSVASMATPFTRSLGILRGEFPRFCAASFHNNPAQAIL